MELTLIQVNDVHSYLELHTELFWTAKGAQYRPAGGYARIATLIKQIRAERPGRVLLFDGGDTLHGTHVAVQTRGEALLPILNALGFDAMTGHWDFAYGPQHLKALSAQLNYPMLAANCFDEKTDRPYFPPFKVCEVAGLRVGVIGLAAYILDKTMPPSFSQGIYLTLGTEVLPGLIAQLRQDEQADLIVVVSHLGFPQDLQLAHDVEGIDVILSAHTHNRVTTPARVNQTLIIQSGSHGSFVGRLDLTIEDSAVSAYHHELITVDETIIPDKEVQALVEAALAPTRAELAHIVGETNLALHRNTALEATMDNFLLRSLIECTDAQLAFSNAWRYGAPIAPGPVTLGDLYNIIPMNPPVSTIDLTGAEVHAMLEEALEHTFSRSPYQQMGGYLKRSLGLSMYVKLENPAGQRIQRLFIGDKTLDPKQVYPTTFVTLQGVPAHYGQNRQNLDIHAIDAMQQALARGPVDSALRGSVVVI